MGFNGDVWIDVCIGSSDDCLAPSGHPIRLKHARGGRTQGGGLCEAAEGEVGGRRRLHEGE